MEALVTLHVDAISCFSQTPRLGDGVLELAHHRFQSRLLVLVQLSQSIHLLHAMPSQLDLTAKVWQVSDPAGHIRALDHIIVPFRPLRQAIREQSSGVRHRQRRRPLPALACTTSVPPSCVLFVSASMTSADSALLWRWHRLENSGRMVTPACPPMTGTSTRSTSTPALSA